MTGLRAMIAPPYAGKSAWYGVMPNGRKVVNSDGRPIIYMTPEAADTAVGVVYDPTCIFCETGEEPGHEH
jgi:hypothetical protein